MRRFVRSVPLQVAGRNSQPAYNPEANEQKLKNWSSRLNNLASSGASKMYMSQLGALMNYYNRGATGSTQVLLNKLSKSTGMTGSLASSPKDLLIKCRQITKNPTSRSTTSTPSSPTSSAATPRPSTISYSISHSE